MKQSSTLARPRRQRGSRIVVCFLLILGCILWSSFTIKSGLSWETLVRIMSSLLGPLFPLHTAVYLLNLGKVRGSFNTFNKLFSRTNSLEKSAISVGVGAVFFCQNFNLEDQKVDLSKMGDIFLHTFLLTILIWLVDYLKLRRNVVEAEIMIEKDDNHANVGKGLAMAYFRYIENVIKGEILEGCLRSPPHKDALGQYIEKEFGESDRDQRDWFGKKIFIFFPESDKVRGNIRDIREREKEEGEQHGLVMETIKHEYMAAGQKRISVLNVLKVKDKKTQILHKCNGACPPLYRRGRSFAPESVLNSGSESPDFCPDYHERVEWQNNYVIFAENRPLNTLYYMVDEPCIDFTQRDFELQFKIYYQELQRLLSKDSVCRGQYELFLYQDFTKRRINFSRNIVNKINSMKMMGE